MNLRSFLDKRTLFPYFLETDIEIKRRNMEQTNQNPSANNSGLKQISRFEPFQQYLQ